MDISDKKAEMGQALDEYLGEPKREAYKKGDKFTMEITEVLISEDGSPMFRLNGFTNLLVDEEMLDNSTKAADQSPPPPPSPFARQERYADYYFINDMCKVETSTEMYDNVDRSRYETGNYSSDGDLMGQRALHEELNRLLWRYSEERKWQGEQTFDPWLIVIEDGAYMPSCIIRDCYCLGAIYFSTRAAADAAIETIVKPFMKEHPEFDPCMEGIF